MKIGEFIAIPTGPFAGQLGEVLQIREKVVILRSGNLRLEVQRDVLEAVEEAEEESGQGESRRRPLKSHFDDELPRRKEERKAPRQQPTATQGPPTPPPPPAPETPTTPTVVVKKEERPMSTITTTRTPAQQPARVEPLYCPTCPPGDQPKLRRKPADLVCGDCYRLYTDEAAIGLARGQTFVNVFQWALGKAPAMLATLDEQYATAKADVDALGKQIGAEVYEALKKSSGGQTVPKEVWNTAFQKQKQERWRAAGGNVKFARMKGLESRITLLKSILEKAKEQPPATATPTPPAVTESPAPAPPAEPTEKPVKAPRKKAVKAKK